MNNQPGRANRPILTFSILSGLFDQMVDCALKPTNAVVISHEREATQRLFGAVRAFIETAEGTPRTSIDSKSEIKFTETGSSYFIGPQRSPLTPELSHSRRSGTWPAMMMSELDKSVYSPAQRLLASVICSPVVLRTNKVR